MSNGDEGDQSLDEVDVIANQTDSKSSQTSSGGSSDRKRESVYAKTGKPDPFTAVVSEGVP